MLAFCDTCKWFKPRDRRRDWFYCSECGNPFALDQVLTAKPAPLVALMEGTRK